MLRPINFLRDTPWHPDQGTDGVYYFGPGLVAVGFLIIIYVTYIPLYKYYYYVSPLTYNRS